MLKMETNDRPDEIDSNKQIPLIDSEAKTRESKPEALYIEKETSGAQNLK
jgi:hypothetical protein